eukprot:Pgem_evm1s19056
MVIGLRPIKKNVYPCDTPVNCKIENKTCFLSPVNPWETTGYSCSECESGYYLSNNNYTCSRCFNTTSYCSKWGSSCFHDTNNARDSLACIGCEKGFHLNPNKNSCDNCLQGLNVSKCAGYGKSEKCYENTNVKRCDSCDLDHFLSNNTCIKCSEPMDCSKHSGKCSSSGFYECEECVDGFAVNTNFTCSHCQQQTLVCRSEQHTSKCVEYNSSITTNNRNDNFYIQCRECKEGYFIDYSLPGLCLKTIGNCQEYSFVNGITMCSQCDTDFVLNSDQSACLSNLQVDNSSGNQTGTLSAGVIAAISVCAFLFAVGIVAAFVIFWKKYQKARKRGEEFTFNGMSKAEFLATSQDNFVLQSDEEYHNDTNTFMQSNEEIQSEVSNIYGDLDTSACDDIDNEYSSANYIKIEEYASPSEKCRDVDVHSEQMYDAPSKGVEYENPSEGGI